MTIGEKSFSVVPIIFWVKKVNFDILNCVIIDTDISNTDIIIRNRQILLKFLPYAANSNGKKYEKGVSLYKSYFTSVTPLRSEVRIR